MSFTLTLGGAFFISESVLPADSLVAQPTTPTHDFYNFVGWYTDSDLDYFGNTEVSWPYQLTSDVTIYAIWTPIVVIETPGGAACFVQGTRILTQNGYKAVETLLYKDLILTPDRRVIDYKLLKTTLSTTTLETAPYLVKPHAFGHNIPEAPLRLSPTHKIQLSKGLWTSPEKAALTNPLVSQYGVGEPVTYYHMECANYLKDNIVAEGAIVESYGTMKSTGGRKDVYTWNARLNAYTRIANKDTSRL
jgi:uncharacterized repeat protein (TIGR02543 family)